MNLGKKSSLFPAFLLFVTAFIWGSAFLAQKEGMDYVGPFSFTMVRGYIGSAFLALFLLVRNYLAKKKRSPDLKFQISNLKFSYSAIGGSVCGIVLYTASLMQQIGILYTTPAISGFLTTLYLLFIPFFCIFLGQRPGIHIWIGCVLAFLGLWFICGGAGAGGQLGRGEVFTIVCAVFFSLQVLCVNHFVKRSDILVLSCFQLLSSAIVGTLVLCIPFVLSKLGICCPSIETLLQTPGMLAISNDIQMLSVPNLKKAAFTIFYAGVLSSGVAYTLQNYAQEKTPPALAAILMSLESMFALLLGWLIRHDLLSSEQLIGCALLFCAALTTQLLEIYIPPRSAKTTACTKNSSET